MNKYFFDSKKIGSKTKKKILIEVPFNPIS